LISHSPPRGHVDEAGGEHLGSWAVLDAIERIHPPLVLCGHVHDAWGSESRVDSARVLNLGPGGTEIDL
jgi:Icc-related predicted phosphoesterase